MEILGAEATRACPECNSIFHEDCWAENRGCAVYGCPQVPATEQRNALEIPPSYWGRETKPCPQCGNEILAAAKRCRVCGAVFTSAEPVAADDFRAHRALEARMPGLRRSIVVLLFFCLMPFSAPLGLIFGGFWYLKTRTDIASMPVLWSGLAKVGLTVAAVEVLLSGTFMVLRMASL
jgi:hypothetical protein